MNIAKTFLGGIKWTGLSAIVVSIAQLIKIAVLARLLDKADFGLMAIVIMVIGFTNIFLDLGITAAVLHKQKISKTEYSSLYWLNLLISFLLFAIIFISSPLVSGFYDEPELTVLIPLAATNLFIVSFSKLFKTIEQKALNFKYISIIEIISAFISLTIAIYLAYAGFGVYSLVWSMLLPSFLAGLIYFVNGIRKTQITFHFSYKETKPFLRIGLYQTGSQIMNYFTREFDILIVGKVLGTETLGLYSLAKQLVQRPLAIINPVLTKITAPLLAKLQEQKGKLKHIYLQLISLLAFVIFPVYGLLAVLAKPLVIILYGKEYIDAALVVSFLCVVYAFRSIGNPIGGLVIAKGRTDLEFIWNFALLFIYPLVIYFSSLKGIYFLAASLAAFRLVLIFPGWKFLLSKLMNVGFIEYLKSYLKAFTKATISSLITWFIMYYLTLVEPFSIVIISSFIFSVSYILLSIKELKTYFISFVQIYR